jgi:hypothetical protein
MQKPGGRPAYPPRFKKRGDKDDRRFSQGFEIDEVNARINLRKMGGWIRYRERRDLIGPPRTSASSSGPWVGTFPSRPSEDHLGSAATKMGTADRGGADFMSLADGDQDCFEGHAVGTGAPCKPGALACGWTGCIR